MSTSLKETDAAICDDMRLPEAVEPCATRATTQPERRLRLLILMARGGPGALPEAWRSYAQIEDARANGSMALRNPEVLRVAIVEDGLRVGGSVNPLRFVEWVG